MFVPVMRGTGTQRRTAGDSASKNSIWIGENNAWERWKGTYTWGGAKTRMCLDTMPQVPSAQGLKHRLLKSQGTKHTPHTKLEIGLSFIQSPLKGEREKLQKMILYSEPFLHLAMKSQGGDCLGKLERAVVQRGSPRVGEHTLLARPHNSVKLCHFVVL